MTQLRLTPIAFQRALVPTLALNSAKNDSELFVAAQVMRKIREISTPEELSEEQKNNLLVPVLKLNSEEEYLLLDDVESVYVEDLLCKQIVRVNLLVSDIFHDLLMQLRRTSQEED
ncbi:MAG TPA: hypothetical protein VIY48_14705 [Candidatus Paceibacterota bacterium]